MAYARYTGAIDVLKLTASNISQFIIHLEGHPLDSVVLANDHFSFDQIQLKACL